MASTTVGHRAEAASTPQVKRESGFWPWQRKPGKPAHATAAQPAAPSAPPTAATTRELPAVPDEPASRVEVVVHHNPAQTDPNPVLAAISQDAVKALAGQISAPDALLKLRTHIDALDWRLTQTRRAAFNKAQAEQDIANLLAADAAATAAGATVVADPASMVDAVLRRADLASRPEAHTQAVPIIPAPSEFPAHMTAPDIPTIGRLRPASELGAGDFLLDVQAIDAPDPLSMWRAVGSVAPLGDGQLTVTFKDGRSISLELTEQVWILPPIEGRHQRDAASNAEPSPVHSEPDGIAPPVPATAAAVIPLPHREPHPEITVLPASVDADGETSDPMHAVKPAREPLEAGAWLLDEGCGTTGPVWLLLKNQRGQLREQGPGAVLEFANGHKREVSGADQVYVLDPQRAKELLADVEARRAEVAAR